MNDGKKPLLGLTTSELRALCTALGLPAFTGGQIAKWLYEKHVADIDEMTNLSKAARRMLTEGYAVIERNDKGEPTLEAYFNPHKTLYYEAGKTEPVDVHSHEAPYPLLVPMIYRPDAKRPFGHSRISRSCMDIQQSALRTMLRSEVGAEFYSVPQKWIVGLSQDSEFNNKAATLSTFMGFTNDEDGNHPTLGQFEQMSMTPHLEHMKMLASMFAGETGLTLDDLGDRLIVFLAHRSTCRVVRVRKDEQLRLLAHDLVEERLQAALDVLLGWMEAVGVCGLDEQDVRALRVLVVVDDGLVGLAEVAAEEQTMAVARAAVYVELHQGGAEDVAGVVECECDALEYLARLAHVDRHHVRH